MATNSQEVVYWTNGEVWVTDSRVVFVDMHYTLDRFEEVSLVMLTFKQRWHYLLLAFVLGSTFFVANWLLWRGQPDYITQSLCGTNSRRDPPGDWQDETRCPK